MSFGVLGVLFRAAAGATAATQGDNLAGVDERHLMSTPS